MSNEQPKRGRKSPLEAKREAARYIQKSEWRYPMTLQLEFSRPVSLASAREIARQLMDSLQVSVQGFEAPEDMDGALLKCAELRRVIRLVEAEPPASPPDDCLRDVE